MAKRGRRALPARKEDRVRDDSLLIQSAESLGRVLGSLRRQVSGVAKSAGRAEAAVNPPGEAARKPRKTVRATASRKSTAARNTSKKR